MLNAYVISFILALEGAFAFVFASAMLRNYRLDNWRKTLGGLMIAGVVLGLLVGVLPQWPPIEFIRHWLTRGRHFVALFLISGGLIWFGRHNSIISDDVPPPPPKPALILLALIFSTFLFPEAVYLPSTVADIGRLVEAPAGASAASAFGIIIAALTALIFDSLASRFRLGRLISLPLLFFLLLGVKMLGFGAMTLSLAPASAVASQIINQLIHDSLHLFFVIFQAPDHPFLNYSIYQFILELLNPTAHSILAAIIASIPIMISWRAFQKRPTPVFADGIKDSEKRIALAAFRNHGRKVGSVFVIAVGMIWLSIIMIAGLRSEPYDPAPIPVIAEADGTINVSLTDVAALEGGSMAKYSFSTAEEVVVFMLVVKPDSGLAVVLDVCEICPPQGYSMISGGFLLCKYCQTPIPMASVGSPGGCNPVPFEDFAIKGETLSLDSGKLINLYRKVIGGQR